VWVRSPPPALRQGRSFLLRLDRARAFDGLDTLSAAIWMTAPEISSIAPFFIVRSVPAALSFYRDRLGFEITFQGPADDDIFFGIVCRGGAMIMFKDVGVDPLPNPKREAGARWDAYVHVPDPDALAAEFSARQVEFSQPLRDDDDGLRGFEVEDADGYVLFFGRPRS
jgi:catechol 2,3-dioxygenase-like lactoylglutathione lyase family enzyme